jgi:uncharacterized protein DUF4190
MSDTSQGPGWWFASDGKWYPPESWTGPPPTAGAATYAQPGVHMLVSRPTNGLAVASLVCSCVGIIPIFFGLPCILGIVFGFVSRSQIRSRHGAEDGSGLALAGIIVGFSLIALFVLIVSLAIAFAGSQACNNNFSSYSCSVN